MLNYLLIHLPVICHWELFFSRLVKYVDVEEKMFTHINCLWNIRIWQHPFLHFLLHNLFWLNYVNFILPFKQQSDVQKHNVKWKMNKLLNNIPPRWSMTDSAQRKKTAEWFNGFHFLRKFTFQWLMSFRVAENYATRKNKCPRKMKMKRINCLLSVHDTNIYPSIQINDKFSIYKFCWRCLLVLL